MSAALQARRQAANAFVAWLVTSSVKEKKALPIAVYNVILVEQTAEHNKYEASYGSFGLGQCILAMESTILKH